MISWIRRLFFKRLNIYRSDTKINSTRPYRIWFKEINIDRLYEIGFISDTRGYRFYPKQTKYKKYSLHIIRTGGGWHLHIDKEIRDKRKKYIAYKHRMSKGKNSQKLVNKFVRMYNGK